MTRPDFSHVYGVDFSGAKFAGRNTWLCHAVTGRDGRLDIHELNSLEAIAGTAERLPALAALVVLIVTSTNSLWGMDFPFGLPLELFDPGTTWAEQFEFVRGFDGAAYDCGLECVRRAVTIGGSMHIRRTTDIEAKTPFDCYHYRIIYQTYFGMVGVIDPLRMAPGTAILPFQYSKWPTAKRTVVESCPSSTLKRLGLPYRNYKQPAGGALTAVRRRTRHAILAGLEPYVQLEPVVRRIVMSNGGGDALDAVLAAVGANDAIARLDHATLRKHPRYRHEGFLYV